jgi:hypothetical protein
MRLGLILVSMLLLSGCAVPKMKVYDLTAYQQVAPRSILVVPVVNQSLDVDASNYVLSTLSVPLAELGYYVFPVNTVKVVLEQEGLHEPEQIRRMEASQLAALFGADAVFYVTIKRWDAQYAFIATTVTVEFEYEMTSRDGRKIWEAKKQMVYSPQQNQSGHPLAVLIAAAITAAATRAAPNYLPLTQQANNAALIMDPTRLPPGPYATDKTTTAAAARPNWSRGR